MHKEYNAQDILQAMENNTFRRLSLQDLKERAERRQKKLRRQKKEAAGSKRETAATIQAAPKNQVETSKAAATGAPGRIQLPVERLPEVIATVNQLGEQGNLGEEK